MTTENKLFRWCFWITVAGATLAIVTADSGPAYWLKLWILEVVR